MNQLALVANHRNAWPSREEIAALGVTGLRSIVYSNDEFEQALAGVPKDVRIVAMLNNEHEDVKSDWSDWGRATKEFADRFAGRVYAVECGNELDLWGLTPEFGADLAREADASFINRISTLLASVAGPNWQDWITKAALLSGRHIDGVCLHPYGQRPDGFRDEAWGFGYLRSAVEIAYGLSGDRPVYLTEWGVKVSDAGGVQGQSEYLSKGAATLRDIGANIVPFAAYFAWSDKVGRMDERGDDGFGLRQENGNARPAWLTFAHQSTLETGPIVVPPKEPPPVPAKTVYTLNDVREIRWQAIAPKAEYHSDWGFEQNWRDHPELGSPLTTQELTLDTGEQCRPFANGICVYRDGRVEVVG